jgi:hypothetical protein
MECRNQRPFKGLKVSALNKTQQSAADETLRACPWQVLSKETVKQ